MVKELPSPYFARRELRLAGYLSFVIDDFFDVLPTERLKTQQSETCNVPYRCFTLFTQVLDISPLYETNL